MKNLYKIENELYIVDNTKEINKDTKTCWCIDISCNELVLYQGVLSSYHYKHYKKIIMTTDKSTNVLCSCGKDCGAKESGVQAIPDEFLEWFVKNPSCESVDVAKEQYHQFVGNTKLPLKPNYKIIIPQEEEIKSTNCGNKNCQNGVINGVNPKLCKKCNPKEEPKQREMFFINANTIIDTRKPKQETLEEEVECNMCGGYMYLSSNEEIYICTNSECTRCYEEYEEDEVDSKETLEEAAERLQKDKYGIFISKDADVKGQLVINTARAAFLSGMKEGANWQAERMYSEDEVIEILYKREKYTSQSPETDWFSISKWFEQFKKK